MSRKNDVRLCRLRPWRTFVGFGFHLQQCPKSVYVINFIESNSPAATGGLKFWDILLKINGKDVREITHLEIKNSLKSARNHYDQYVELLVIQRKYYQQNLTDEFFKNINSFVEIITTPSYMPDDYRRNAKNTPRVCEIRLGANETKFGFDGTYGNDYIGMFIHYVKPNSPAYKSGLQKCDRVIEVNDKYVDKTQTLVIIDMIKKCLAKKYIKLLVVDTQTYQTSTSISLGKLISRLYHNDRILFQLLKIHLFLVLRVKSITMMTHIFTVNRIH